MAVRAAKIALTGAVALYLALVVFNNLTDYGSNYAFVAHVLAMDTTFPGNAAMWRAVNATWIHHVFYVTIIAWEAIACALIGAGAWRLWRVRRGPAPAFNDAKQFAIAGLALNLLQWLVAFITVGGEWFLMWQSRVWNGNDTAGRMFLVVGVTLLFVNSADGEPSRR
jgi:predicted small integral membrane protein